MRVVVLRHCTFLAVLGMAVTMLLAGCGGGDDSGTPTSSGKEAAEAAGGTDEHASHNHSDEEAIAENLSKLSDDDRALAVKQKLCPIGEGPLGGMGVPYKLTLNGQTIFLCCDGCKDKAEEDPEGTLAAVAKLVGDEDDENPEPSEQ